MLYILIIIAAVFISNNAVNSVDCRTVKQGAHYPSLIPFHGFKSDAIISERVQFTKSAANYTFPSTEPDSPACTISWNKLWGACRCGYLANNHNDSDRFVFRRPQNCLVDESERVNGDINNCSGSNLVEIAAYAYDHGDKPFENEGRLLKEFSTKLRIDIWYKITLIFEETKTTYQLFDDNDQHLETQEIDHRQCNNFKLGTLQTLYFGGQCPAPQDVSVCYDKA
jgi:hypothetical protein